MHSLTDWTSYFDPITWLSLEVPRSWEAGEVKGLAMVLVGPESQGFRVNVGANLYSLPDATPEQFEKAIALAQQNLKEGYVGYQLIKEDRGYIDGNPAYQQWYRWAPPKMAHPLSQSLTLIMAGGQGLYELNGTCLQSQEVDMMPTISRIIDSIRIIPQRAFAQTNSEN